MKSSVHTFIGNEFVPIASFIEKLWLHLVQISDTGYISCLRGVAVLLKDRFDMPGSIGVEGKQQKKSKNYTKNALRVADNAMIEGACIHREARR